MFHDDKKIQLLFILFRRLLVWLPDKIWQGIEFGDIKDKWV